MKHLLYSAITAVLLLIATNGISQSLPQEQKASVARFIENVNNQNWKELSKSIAYPLKRNYPIPPIASETEFIERHSEVFDENLISRITHSKIDTDWSEVGSKGIMFDNGKIWLDATGNMTACNYQSNEEKELEKELIQADKDALPASLKEFERPILQMKVSKFVVRVDQLEDESYRFTWFLDGSLADNDEPAEIIQNGILEFDGSGGNHSYTFESDFGKFVCLINEIGTTETSPAELIIYREGELFRSFDAIWLKN